MTNEEARAYFIDCNERIISVAKDENIYNYETQQVEDVFMRRTFEANELAIKALDEKDCVGAISRQAAIDVIFSEPIYKPGMKKRDADEVVPAIYEKIKSLSPVKPQKPNKCEDAISRQAVLNSINAVCVYENEYNLTAKHIKDTVEQLPPVSLKENWTPISEGLPKEGETVIASTKCGVYPEAKYTKTYGWEWLYEAGTEYWVELDDVEAWMPLPELYEPQERSDKE